MKTIIKLVLALIVSVSLFQQLHAAPKTGSNENSAGPVEKSTDPRSKAVQSGDATQILIDTYWVLGPGRASPHYTAFTIAVNNAVMNGTIANPHVASGPGDYTLVSGNRAGWSNFVFSTTAFPTWQGMANPPSPYDSEVGQIVHLVNVVRGVNGNVALSMYMSKCASPNDAQIDEVQTTLNGSYSQSARGVKADDSVVASGSGDQRVKYFILIVAPELYIASSQGDLNVVMNWVVNDNGNSFSIIMTVTIKNGDTVVAQKSTTISTFPQTFPPLPALAISENGTSGVQVYIPDAVAGKKYPVFFKNTVTGDEGPNPVALLSRNEVVTLPDPGTEGFYILKETL
jgi:hypothetical protein